MIMIRILQRLPVESALKIYPFLRLNPTGIKCSISQELFYSAIKWGLPIYGPAGRISS
jgi:hypothetical protein